MSGLAATARRLLGGTAPVAPGASPSIDAAEKWAADFRRRWHAEDDARELYLRRCSEQAAHEILDDAGVPRGNLSLNGRIAEACRIRYAPGKAKAAAIEPPSSRSADGASDARVLLAELPPAPWPIAASGLSLDVGDVRVRFDGGSPELRRALARWISQSRTWVEQMSGATPRSGKRRSGAAPRRGLRSNSGEVRR